MVILKTEYNRISHPPNPLPRTAITPLSMHKGHTIKTSKSKWNSVNSVDQKLLQSLPMPSASVHGALPVVFLWGLLQHQLTTITKNHHSILNHQNTQCHSILQTTRVRHFLKEYSKSNGYQNIYTRMASFCQMTRSHDAPCHFLIYYNDRSYLHSSPTLTMKAWPLPPREKLSKDAIFKFHSK